MRLCSILKINTIDINMIHPQIQYPMKIPDFEFPLILIVELTKINPKSSIKNIEMAAMVIELFDPWKNANKGFGVSIGFLAFEASIYYIFNIIYYFINIQQNITLILYTNMEFCFLGNKYLYL